MGTLIAKEFKTYKDINACHPEINRIKKLSSRFIIEVIIFGEE
jgi:hypothetical protein